MVIRKQHPHSTCLFGLSRKQMLFRELEQLQLLLFQVLFHCLSKFTHPLPGVPTAIDLADAFPPSLSIMSTRSSSLSAGKPSITTSLSYLMSISTLWPQVIIYFSEILIILLFHKISHLPITLIVALEQTYIMPYPLLYIPHTTAPDQGIYFIAK